MSRAKVVFFMVLLMAAPAIDSMEQIHAHNFLKDDQPVSLRFFGSTSADLFTRELDESLHGVLEKNFVEQAKNGFPAGFVNASLPGFPWAGTMWTRDAGAFMRELVMRGYYEHAALLAQCLMNLVEKNQDGFYAFPRYFKASKPEPGPDTELDGTASIVIGMELLWERLPNGNQTKSRISEFLLEDASPINYFKFYLKTHPLMAGSGEFGCGVGIIKAQCYNVVQNDLVMLALLAVANFAQESGNNIAAKEDRRLAIKVREGMEKYLVGQDGSWIWCIDPKSMKPDPTLLEAPANRGTGSLNGVGSMYADVMGFEPLTLPWRGIRHSEKTFQRLYNVPLRKTEFDRFGIWTQYDVLEGGLFSSPSYGQGYAIQTMLLFDKLDMADKALSWLADATYDPTPEYKLHRASRYYFYERTYSPDTMGKAPFVEGCGALNLVNVAEPLKVSRLMLGVDDHSLEEIDIIPRIPPGWAGVEARNWPIRTRYGIVRANIVFRKNEGGAEFTLTLLPGEQIDDLKVRMPAKGGFVWDEERDTGLVYFVTH